MTRPSFTPSAETRLIEQEMRKMNKGDLITYARIEDICGAPHSRVRYAVKTAMKHLEREEGMVFHNIANVGYRRSTDVDIVNQGSADIEKTRRMSGRALKRQLKADFSELPQDLQVKAAANASVLGTISMMTKPASIAQIASKIDAGTKELPFHKTIAMFLPNMKDDEDEAA